ncbi:hypothetical protein NEUTE2DRAFT_134033 [Neurospora tetrasperma FGSC 2509]|nr:hypothetical protein NEUTE2DRAFT_134033 [Neurospora tetrasperma FGSC 2509]
MALAEPVEIGTKCTTLGNVGLHRTLHLICTREQISTKKQEANERSGPLQVLPSFYLQGDNIHILAHLWAPESALPGTRSVAPGKQPRGNECARQGWNKEKTIHFVGYETDDANEREKIAVAVVDPKDDFDIRLADWRHPMGIQWVEIGRNWQELAGIGRYWQLLAVSADWCVFLERSVLGSVLLLLAEDACSIVTAQINQWLALPATELLKPSNLISQVDGECVGRDATSNCV